MFGTQRHQWIEDGTQAFLGRFPGKVLKETCLMARPDIQDLISYGNADARAS